jgi:molybdenum cofactor synthesis domain-containing protein
VSEPAKGRFRRTAFVLTTSDRSAAGTREDASGAGVAERLEALGFTVERSVVADDQPAIEGALKEAADRHPLVVTTGGTGLTPRDVTPQATLAVVDYEVPGLAEAMRAEGREQTPFASLSRAVVGVRGRTLIVNVPGSPKGALESIEAIVPVLDHALETLAGPFEHGSDAGAAPDGDGGGHGDGGGGDAPGDSTEDQHEFGRDVPPVDPKDGE